MRSRRINSRFLADGQDLDDDVDYSVYKKKVPTQQKRRSGIVANVMNQFFEDSRTYRRPRKIIRTVAVTLLNSSKDDSDLKKEDIVMRNRTKDEYDIRKKNSITMDIDPKLSNRKRFELEMKQYDSPATMLQQGKNYRQETIEKLRKLRLTTKKLNFRSRTPIFKNVYETPKRVFKNYEGNRKKITRGSSFRRTKSTKKSITFKKRLQPRSLFRDNNMYF